MTRCAPTSTADATRPAASASDRTAPVPRHLANPCLLRGRGAYAKRT